MIYLSVDFSQSLDRNISSPITNILGAIDLLKERLTLNNDNDNKILEILETETNKVKNYINKTLNFHYEIIPKEEQVNIHECLVEALDQ